MAPKATIYKVNLTIADMTRHYYQDHILTVAQHPSETDLRLLMRIVAFALNADEQLKFGKGISSAEEPDVWEVDLTGQIVHWIDLGQPAEKRLRQACGKSGKVSIYTYQRGAAFNWYSEVKTSVERFAHLRIIHLAIADEKVVARLLERTMNLTCTIEDGMVMLSNHQESLTVQLHVLKESKH